MSRSVSLPLVCLSLTKQGTGCLARRHGGRFTSIKGHVQQIAILSRAFATQPETTAQSENQSGSSGLKSAPPKLNCDRGDVIFANRSSKQLLRALFSLQCCSHNILVQNSMKLMKLGQRIMGERLFSAVMKATIYGHFVAGEKSATIDNLARDLSQVGVSGLVSEMLEEDVGERTGRARTFMRMCTCIRNIAKICVSYDKQLLVSQHTWYPPINAEKVSAIANASVLEKVSQIWRDGGMQIENDGLVSVQNILDGLNGKLKPIPGLTSDENSHFQHSLKRLDEMAKKAVEKGVQLFIDAERNNIQPAIKLMAVATMWKYNKDKPWVWSTYQAYLKGSLEDMEKDVKFLESKNVCFGAKIVRGAYIEYEKTYIKDHPNDDYVRPSYNATTEAYHVLMDYGLSLVKDWGVKRCNIILATQNEKSAQRGVERMWELGIPARSGAVLFAQQLGMADHVSVALGQAGYPVYKLFPCGTVIETVPYMTRRAQENHSVFLRIGKEKQMLRQELMRRLLRRKVTAN
ncbi:hydroxyproline dehydrogenase-like [Amphiura filiformis]|uniref:hydroxyproline dehydrogenase-like n=1 Tax=Amphiura filiformis TaxID=82378 RepID=UPI003B2206C6